MGSRALVLMYHQIADVGVDPSGLAVTPENFAEQLSVLKGRCEVVPLREIQMKRSSLSNRPRVAITFDDGYADNGEVGAPILEAAGLPASFFITGLALNGQGEFWWDSLGHLLLDLSDQTAPQDPFEVVIDGQRLRVDLRTLEARMRAQKALNRRLRVRPPEEITPVLEALSLHVGTKIQTCERHRLAGMDGIQRLSRIPGMAIGSHTMSHPLMPALNQEDQRHELVESRRLLADAIEKPVFEFAFPFGNEDAFDDASEIAVRDAGYVLACQTVFGLVKRRTNPYQFPRAMVHDINAEDFEERLSNWFRGHSW